MLVLQKTLQVLLARLNNQNPDCFKKAIRQLRIAFLFYEVSVAESGIRRSQAINISSPVLDGVFS